MTNFPRPSELADQRVLFITGHLASSSVRDISSSLADKYGFIADVLELGISVAALIHVDWLLRKLPVELPGVDMIVLPGWVQGEITAVSDRYQIPVYRGPKNILDLPEYFQRGSKATPALTTYDIEILAEINHAPRMSVEQIIVMAESYAADGANLIDLGCIPGETWSEIGTAVRELRSRELRVSVDSFDRTEVTAAVEAGAELVLSCNGTNIDWAVDLDVEWVVIPDDIRNIDTLEPTLTRLRDAGRRFRLDPIVEPIGFGFANSLGRYLETRRRYPDVEIMMGIGNLTELTEADTAGMNLILAGFCQEIGIRSVLTTQVINWARSAVREFDLARRQTWHAIQNKTLPKHLSSDLVMLRDPRLGDLSPERLAELSGELKDPNYRIYKTSDALHLMNRDGHWQGVDPYQLFAQAMAASPKPMDASHAFYLGYELCKAMTALTLGKAYTQDEALNWGFLTVPEKSVHEKKVGTHNSRRAAGEMSEGDG